MYWHVNCLSQKEKGRECVVMEISTVSISRLSSSFLSLSLHISSSFLSCQPLLHTIPVPRSPAPLQGSLGSGPEAPAGQAPNLRGKPGF